jgi:hypothetical protein
MNGLVILGAMLLLLSLGAHKAIKIIDEFRSNSEKLS